MEEKVIQPFILKYSVRSRRIRIGVHVDGRVVVSAPLGVSVQAVQRFVATHNAWIEDKKRYFASFEGVSLRGNSKKNFTRYKDTALHFVTRRLRHFNSLYGFRVGRITIKNTRSRWGSCSKRGNLSFNYKIALLPQELADYIVVHELCHLGEFNHSQAFWDLVARAVPEYRATRARLKKQRLTFG